MDGLAVGDDSIAKSVAVTNAVVAVSFAVVIGGAKGKLVVFVVPAVIFFVVTGFVVVSVVVVVGNVVIVCSFTVIFSVAVVVELILIEMVFGDAFVVSAVVAIASVNAFAVDGKLIAVSVVSIIAGAVAAGAVAFALSFNLAGDVVVVILVVIDGELNNVSIASAASFISGVAVVSGAAVEDAIVAFLFTVVLGVIFVDKLISVEAGGFDAIVVIEVVAKMAKKIKQ